MEELGGLQSKELKRVRRDWAINTFASWLLRSLTLTCGGQILSYSTRMTIPPTLKCPKASCLMDYFLLYHISVCSAQGKKWAGSFLHCSQSSLRIYQAFPYLWVVLNCSLHFVKVDLVISSVQMSQFPHMAYNISNWENSFTGILQSPSPKQVLLKKEVPWPAEKRDAQWEWQNEACCESRQGGGRDSGHVAWRPGDVDVKYARC